jgi:hypothetical protein
MVDVKSQLVQSLQGEYLKGFNFAYEENETHRIASLTNDAARKLIAIDDDATSMTVRYIQVHDKKSDTNAIYKLDVVKRSENLSLVSTDVRANRVVKEIVVPEFVRQRAQDDHTYDTLEECIASFDNSEIQIGLQQEANKTCEYQTAHIHCELTDGSSVSVVLIVEPTAWRCFFNVGLPKSPTFLILAQEPI